MDQRRGDFMIQYEHRQSGMQSLVGTSQLDIWGDIDFLATLASGQTFPAVHATASDPRTAPRYASTYGPRGTEAMVIVPLIRGNEWAGALGLAQAEARTWSDREVILARAAAERIWPAYEAARAWAAERCTHDRLAASEERFRLMADSAPVLIWISGIDKRRTWFNRQWLELVAR